MKTLTNILILVCVLTCTALTGCHGCQTACCHKGTCQTCTATVTHPDCPTCQHQ